MTISELIDQLEYDDGVWEGDIEFPVLGRDVLLVFDGENGEPPTIKQKERLKWLLKNIARIYPLVEKKIIEYYEEGHPIYGDSNEDFAIELMPELKSDTEIWNYVTEPGIYIPADSKENEIHLEYEYSFDVENGLRVVIRNAKIHRVGI